MIIVNGGSPGVPAVGVASGATITVTDSIASPAPATRLWSITSKPGVLATPPTFATPTSASSTVTLPLYGTYTIHLDRVEANGDPSPSDVLVLVVDAEGNCLPSPGMNPALLLPLSAADAAAGWAGGDGAVTGQAMLEKFLRDLKTGSTGDYPVETFTPTMTMDHNARQVFPAGSVPLVISRALTGHKAGAQKIATLAAGSGRPAVVFADSFTPESEGDQYDAITGATKDYVCILTQLTSGITKVFAYFVNAPAAGAATITAQIPAATPNKVVVTSSNTPARKLWVPGLTGIDLTGTSRVLTGLPDGLGTPTLTFPVDAPFVFGETPSLRLQTGHGFADLDTNKVANGSISIVNHAASILGVVMPMIYLHSRYGVTGTTTITQWVDRAFGVVFAGTAPGLNASNALFGGAPSAHFTGGQYLASAAALDLTTTNAVTVYHAMIKNATSATGQVYDMLGNAFGDTPQYLFGAHTGGPTATCENYFNQGGGLALASSTTAGLLMTTVHVVKTVVDYSATTTIRSRVYIDDMTTPVITATAACAAGNFANTRKLAIGNVAALNLGGLFDLGALVLIPRVGTATDDTVVKAEFHTDFATAA